MKADSIILQIKYSGVIKTLAEMGNVSFREALDMFYKSQIYIEMREGISDMHCRSDKYLAEELLEEYRSAQPYSLLIPHP
jgi:hypothetical protein